MKEMIKNIPIPLSGVMLGVASLGNLLQSYAEVFHLVCGIASGFLLLLLLLKLIFFFDVVKKELKNPIIASVSATFTMGLMILSTYIKPVIGQGAFYLWLFAVALHIVLMISFTFQFVLKLDLKKVYASYFIVYAGLAVAAITAPAYEMKVFGSVTFWCALLSVLCMLIVVSFRYVKLKEVPEPAKALACIYAAPISVCVTGYVQSVEPKSFVFLVTIYGLAFLLYIVGFVQMIRCIKLPFYPSMAAFTFPFVISAIASKQTMVCLVSMGKKVPFLQYIVLFQTIVAMLLVVYTYLRFLKNIVKKSNSK